MRQYLDYYPFGALRVDEQYGYTNERHKFTGHEYDDQTGLYYMQARYQLPTVGRFVSQDPSFINLGTDKKNDRTTLEDPQRLNSYAYSGNNPLTNRDADGKDYFNFDNGGGICQGTGVTPRYESVDRQILINNAATVQSALLPPYTFYSNVKNNSVWDYKNNTDVTGRADGYIFDGKVVSSADFGNINYGYTGTAAGLPADMLLWAGGAVQVYNDSKNSYRKTGKYGVVVKNGISTYFDNPDDPPMISKGINAYRNSAGGGCVNCTPIQSSSSRGGSSSSGGGSSVNAHWGSSYTAYAIRRGILQ